MASEPGGDPDFEREKWLADVQLRKQELALRRLELRVKIREQRWARWVTPGTIMVGIIVAAVAAGGNAWVAYFTANAQRLADDRHAQAERELQTAKADGDRELEKGRAEAARILEVVKTADPDKAAINLRFLLDTSLISTKEVRGNIEAYLIKRAGGQGVSTADSSDTGSITGTPSSPPHPTIPDVAVTATPPRVVENSGPSPEQSIVTYETGWIGRGTSQYSACQGALTSLQSQQPNRQFKLLDSSENLQKDPFSGMKYNYRCHFLSSPKA